MCKASPPAGSLSSKCNRHHSRITRGNWFRDHRLSTHTSLFAFSHAVDREDYRIRMEPPLRGRADKRALQNFPTSTRTPKRPTRHDRSRRNRIQRWFWMARHSDQRNCGCPNASQDISLPPAGRREAAQVFIRNGLFPSATLFSKASMMQVLEGIFGESLSSAPVCLRYNWS